MRLCFSHDGAVLGAVSGQSFVDIIEAGTAVTSEFAVHGVTAEGSPRITLPARGITDACSAIFQAAVEAPGRQNESRFAYSQVLRAEREQ